MATAKKRNANLEPISTITRTPLTDCEGEQEKAWNALTPNRSVTPNPHTKGPLMKDTTAETGR